ncbi:chemotaxis protein CheB [Azospirillum formosense]|uniref:chemotaxis protein CheB n=1 Tax=Azospirillum formosense TaxID=861533 RepID=UPI00338FD079
MDKRNILAIGASAGGVTALQRLFAAMPGDVTATVFVVQHVGMTHSVLPTLLSRAGWLPAFHPEDGEPVRSGWIHVAPPDHHLLVKDGCALVRRGARENRCRPAIDPLFRSVAVAYGVRTVGLILTGTLDDGTAGLRAVKRCGGLAMVQDPEDAEWPDMPRNAMRHVAVDACAPLSDLPALLACRLSDPPGPPVPVPADIAVEARIPENEFDAMPGLTASVGKPSTLTCPDCGGNLVEIEDGPLLRFRCKVGHAYGPATLAESHREAIEKAIWVALRTHEDRAIMFRRLAERAREHGHPAVEANWTRSAQEAERTVAMLKEALSKQGRELAGSMADEGED